jgi:hypothetical protein
VRTSFDNFFGFSNNGRAALTASTCSSGCLPIPPAPRRSSGSSSSAPKFGGVLDRPFTECQRGLVENVLNNVRRRSRTLHAIGKIPEHSVGDVCRKTSRDHCLTNLIRRHFVPCEAPANRLSDGVNLVALRQRLRSGQQVCLSSVSR